MGIEGKDAIKRMIKELEETGYLERQFKRGYKGSKYTYKLLETRAFVEVVEETTIIVEVENPTSLDGKVKVEKAKADYPPLQIKDSNKLMNLDTPKRKSAKISPSWKPTDKLREWALNGSIGASKKQIVTETEKFIDHFTATGKPYKNWDAAFRNWMRKAKEIGSLDQKQAKHGDYSTAMQN